MRTSCYFCPYHLKALLLSFKIKFWFAHFDLVLLVFQGKVWRHIKVHLFRSFRLETCTIWIETYIFVSSLNRGDLSHWKFIKSFSGSPLKVAKEKHFPEDHVTEFRVSAGFSLQSEPKHNTCTHFAVFSESTGIAG